MYGSEPRWRIDVLDKLGNATATHKDEISESAIESLNNKDNWRDYQSHRIIHDRLFSFVLTDYLDNLIGAKNEVFDQEGRLYYNGELIMNKWAGMTQQEIKGFDIGKPEGVFVWQWWLHKSKIANSLLSWPRITVEKILGKKIELGVADREGMDVEAKFNELLKQAESKKLVDSKDVKFEDLSEKATDTYKHYWIIPGAILVAILFIVTGTNWLWKRKKGKAKDDAEVLIEKGKVKRSYSQTLEDLTKLRNIKGLTKKELRKALPDKKDLPVATVIEELHKKGLLSKPDFDEIVIEVEEEINNNAVIQRVGFDETQHIYRNIYRFILEKLVEKTFRPRLEGYVGDLGLDGLEGFLEFKGKKEGIKKQTDKFIKDLLPKITTTL